MDAQRDLGNLLGYPGFAGNNAVESLKWLRAAAEHENADAQREIGDIYRGQCLGKPVVDKDLVEAARWYRRAAENGDAEAKRKLGDMYNSGNGVPKDYSEAAKWYKEASVELRWPFESIE